MKFISLAAAGFILASHPAAAQGNGHGNAFGHHNNTVAAAATQPSANAPPAAGTGVRNFGSWLDDASMQDPGRGFVAMGLGFFKTPVDRAIELPTDRSGGSITPA